MSDKIVGFMILVSGAVVFGLAVIAFPGISILQGSDYWLWAGAIAAGFGLLEMSSGAVLTSTGGM